MAHGQPQQKKRAAPVGLRQRGAAQQMLQRIFPALDGKAGVFLHGDHGEQAVAGGDQMLRHRIHRPRPRQQPAAEKGIEAGEGAFFIVRHINARLPEKEGDQAAGGPGIHQTPHRPGDPRPGKQPQRRPARRAVIEKPQHAGGRFFRGKEAALSVSAGHGQHAPFPCAPVSGGCFCKRARCRRNTTMAAMAKTPLTSTRE